MNSSDNQAIKNSNLHHSFDVDLAVELKSVELSILAHHFLYWIKHNASLGRNFHEDRTWTYQTLKEITAYFPYWSQRQVEKYINKLVDAKVLMKGNFNKSPYDRTVWYSFVDEEKFSIWRNRHISLENDEDIPISPNGEIENANRRNRNLQKVTPIPDNKTYNKTNKQQSIVKKSSDPEAAMSNSQARSTGERIFIDWSLEEKNRKIEGVLESDFDSWQKAFPNIDVHQVFQFAQLKILAQPTQYKRRKQIVKTLLEFFKRQSESKSAKGIDYQKNKSNESYSEPGKPNIQYHEEIANDIRRTQGEDAYVEYLMSVNDPSHYKKYKQQQLENEI